MSDRLRAILEELERLDPEELAVLRSRLDAVEASPRASRPSWADLEGIAPDLLEGEDAQAWVSRTRAEGDRWRELP